MSECANCGAEMGIAVRRYCDTACQEEGEAGKKTCPHCGRKKSKSGSRCCWQSTDFKREEEPP